MTKQEIVEDIMHLSLKLQAYGMGATLETAKYLMLKRIALWWDKTPEEDRKWLPHQGDNPPALFDLYTYLFDQYGMQAALSWTGERICFCRQSKPKPNRETKSE